MTEMETDREFPGSPVFMTWHTAMAWVQYLVPGQGTEIPQPTQRSQKKKKKEADNIRLKKGKNDSTQSFPKKREGNRRTGGWTPQSLTTKAMEVLAEEEEKKITYRIQTFFL